MKFGKIIAIIGLALLLIGIAYIQALFSHQDRNDDTISQISNSPAADPLDQYATHDQVAALLDSVRLFYIDSVYQALSDSLEASKSQPTAVTDSIEKELKLLSDKLSGAQKEIKFLRSKNKTEFEKLVYNFYSNEMAVLPSDLSVYERDVSIREIKGKIDKYFGVSIASLNKIVEKYK
jgi:hypothetical protein